ncbi:MAG: response regulator, partial [Elusimicrobiota bacterium]
MTKRKVLVIDDEVDIAKLVVEILTDEGFTAEAVHTGEEGLKKVREWLPDLILLDWQLPDTEGVDVCRIIKNDAEIAYIPVIMLTSLGSESHKIRGLEAGADDYVTKPFSAGELLARVKVMFRRMQREEKVIESKIAQLQKFLPKEMLEKIISAAPRAREGEKRIVTVMIADLSGFTSLAEQLSAEKVTGLINDCFNSLINVISNYGGTIDKFMGDAI